MNRESYLLRHRQRTGKTGEETAETDAVNPLDSDEQDEVVKSLATEANSQATFFTVRVTARDGHQRSSEVVSMNTLLFSLRVRRSWSGTAVVRSCCRFPDVRVWRFRRRWKRLESRGEARRGDRQRPALTRFRREISSGGLRCHCSHLYASVILFFSAAARLLGTV